MDEHFFIYNNRFYRKDILVMGIGNRSLMYGDGLFETMRLHHDILVNKTFHFERFFSGINLLKFPLSENFTEEFFTQKIQQLLLKNKIENNARVRLMAFRKEENSYNHFEGSFNYVIEAWPMEEAVLLNEIGLEIDIFKDARKSCDQFSNIKSNNYLASIMAQLYAKEKNQDECLILNSFGRICESSIANVFIVRGNVIYTPSLPEGCVAGVVRRWLIENLPSPEFQIIQKQLTLEDLFHAEEIFLTNSIRPVRWVHTFRGKKYSNVITRKIARYIHGHMN